VILLVCGFDLMYTVRPPPNIHSDTIWRGEKVTPINGTTLTCFNRFHITATRHDVCSDL